MTIHYAQFIQNGGILQRRICVKKRSDICFKKFLDAQQLGRINPLGLDASEADKTIATFPVEVDEFRCHGRMESAFSL